MIYKLAHIKNGLYVQTIYVRCTPMFNTTHPVHPWSCVLVYGHTPVSCQAPPSAPRFKVGRAAPRTVGGSKCTHAHLSMCVARARVVPLCLPCLSSPLACLPPQAGGIALVFAGQTAAAGACETRRSSGGASVFVGEGACS